MSRRGVTLVELLVVTGVISILVGLLSPAVQQVRAAAAKASCGNRLRQLGLALHNHESAHGFFPPAVDPRPESPYRFLSWQGRLLPVLDQGPLWDRTVAAFATGRHFTDDPPHVGLSTVLPVVICPADPAAHSVQTYVARPAPDPIQYRVTLTSYLGVSGTSRGARDGMLFERSAVRATDVADGMSNTLMVGERPAPDGFRFGWWYAGAGMSRTGALDSHLGVRETPGAGYIPECTLALGRFGSGLMNPACAATMYWSPHLLGGHFLLADGSVRFLRYEADPIMPALATRAGGEVAAVPD